MSGARLAVDMTRCDGHGICALLYGDLIDLDRFGYAVILRDELDGPSLRRARRAVAACPERALSIIGDPSDKVASAVGQGEAR
jgi:ferredoxin